MIKTLIGQAGPADLPGIFTYDSYWREHKAGRLGHPFFRAVTVTYQGTRKTLLNWLKGGGGRGSLTIRDSVNLIGPICLTG